MNTHFLEPEDLQAWLDGELRGERQDAVEQHIQECAECASTLERLKLVTSRLRDWAVLNVPETLRPPAVVLEVARRRWFAWRPVIGLAAMVVVVFLAGREITYWSWMREVQNSKATGLAATTTYPPGRPLLGFTGPTYYEYSDIVPSDYEYERFLARELQSVQSGSPDAQRGRLASDGRRMIVRTAFLVLEVEDFDAAREGILDLVSRAGGFVSHQDFTHPSGGRRRGELTVRIPVDALDATLPKLRAIGRSISEKTDAEEITEQFVDLEARLRNARTAEARLLNILRRATGKVTEVLEVEQALSKKREEIEQMESQRARMADKVQMSTINITFIEEYAERPDQSSGGFLGRLAHAVSDGFGDFMGMVVWMLLFILRWFLHLALFGLVGWQIWRRWLGPGIREHFGDSL